jgi:hypothetical protein
MGLEMIKSSTPGLAREKLLASVDYMLSKIDDENVSSVH